MLELDFEVFMDIVNRNRKDRSEYSRKLHYLEEPDKFTLYIKSSEYWEYYVIVDKSKIIGFGAEIDTDANQSIKDFKTNFLYDAIPLKNKEIIVEDLPEDITKENIIDPGEEMVDESEEYDEFLIRKFGNWQKKIFGFLDETLKDEIVAKEYINKTFGEFVRRLFNSVHTIEFSKGLKHIIKVNLLKGINDIEEQFDIDIGFGPEFDEEAENQVKRQLDGFYVDGKRWAGLKGVASDLQKDISTIVADGIGAGDSLKKIKNNIKEEFNKYTGTDMTEGRATKIARTETTRFINFSRQKAFTETGLKGMKVWDSKLDERTSKICRELHGKKVPLNETFKTKDGEWMFPPSHPNCRSTIKFELSK